MTQNAFPVDFGGSPIPVPKHMAQGLLSLMSGSYMASGPAYAAFKRLVEEWESKEPHICVLQSVLEDAMDALKDIKPKPGTVHADTLLMLQAVLECGHIYELSPTRHTQPDGDVSVCSEDEATQWSIYRRPKRPNSLGQHLAQWVADFDVEMKAEAEASVKALNGEL